MGPPLSKAVQLVSFHTVSKGYWGECGQRGGYFEMTNIPPKVYDSVACCSQFSPLLLNEQYAILVRYTGAGLKEKKNSV